MIFFAEAFLNGERAIGKATLRMTVRYRTEILPHAPYNLLLNESLNQHT
jgi:hypothetical protein